MPDEDHGQSHGRHIQEGDAEGLEGTQGVHQNGKN